MQMGSMVCRRQRISSTVIYSGSAKSCSDGSGGECRPVFAMPAYLLIPGSSAILDGSAAETPEWSVFAKGRS